MTRLVSPAQIAEANDTDLRVLAANYGVALKKVGVNEFAGPCPCCGGNDRFGINLKKRTWSCRNCPGKRGKIAGGDAIALVRHVERVEFTEAVEILTGRHVSDYQPRPIPPIDRSDDDNGEAERLLRAGAIWDGAEPIAGTDGDVYFARRGIVLDDVPDHGGLRWAPRCPWKAGTAPCVIARYTDAVTADPRGIWRRPITGEKPKALGATAGCVIRLWPDDDVENGLVLGEGPETTLAAATRITHRGTYLRPAWAAGSSSNMAAFPPLAGLESLTLLVDHDANRAGERAAEQCASRWVDAGKEVIRLMPGDLGDFNDLVKP